MSRSWLCSGTPIFISANNEKESMNASFGTDLDSAYSLLSDITPTPAAVLTAATAIASAAAGQQQPQEQQPPVKSPASMQGAAAMQQQVASNGSAMVANNKVGGQQQQQQYVYNASQYYNQYNAENSMAARYAAAQQQAAAAQPYRSMENTDPSYFDKLFSKKRDVLKVIMFAMMILLAISFHTFVDFWLKDFVTAYELTYKQELGVRFLYPVLVVIVLWNLKIAMSK